jgi:NADP-dependent 3-hydroxy acid dehydrogenase YdfG
VTRVFVTGSAGGLGRAAAAALLDEGHQVVVHARSRDRLADAVDLIDRGVATVIGNLADVRETRVVAEQVNRLGGMDAVIHNAGLYTGRDIAAVNVVAPYC